MRDRSSTTCPTGPSRRPVTGPSHMLTPWSANAWIYDYDPEKAVWEGDLP
jgi:hypothetical protein